MICSAQIQQMIEECRANGRGFSMGDDQDSRISLEKLAWKHAATAMRRVRDCVARAEKHRASYMPNRSILDRVVAKTGAREPAAGFVNR